MNMAQTSAELRDRFILEQDYIFKYIELLQDKTAIKDSEIREIFSIVSNHTLPSLEIRKDWMRSGQPYSTEEVEDLVRSTSKIKEPLNKAIEEVKGRLRQVDKPEGLSLVDMHSELGEWIQYFIEALEPDMSPNHIAAQRQAALEQDEQSKKRTWNGTLPYNSGEFRLYNSKRHVHYLFAKVIRLRIFA